MLGSCVRWCVDQSLDLAKILEPGTLITSCISCCTVLIMCFSTCSRQTILEIISVVAAFVNSAIVAFTSNVADNATWASRVWLFIGMSTGLLGYVLTLYFDIVLLMCFVVPPCAQY